MDWFVDASMHKKIIDASKKIAQIDDLLMHQFIVTLNPRGVLTRQSQYIVYLNSLYRTSYHEWYAMALLDQLSVLNHALTCVFYENILKNSGSGLGLSLPSDPGMEPFDFEINSPRQRVAVGKVGGLKLWPYKKR